MDFFVHLSSSIKNLFLSCSAMCSKTLLDIVMLNVWVLKGRYLPSAITWFFNLFFRVGSTLIVNPFWFVL